MGDAKVNFWSMSGALGRSDSPLRSGLQESSTSVLPVVGVLDTALAVATGTAYVAL